MPISVSIRDKICAIVIVSLDWMSIIEYAVMNHVGDGWVAARHPRTKRLICRIRGTTIENVHREQKVLISIGNKPTEPDADYAILSDVGSDWFEAHHPKTHRFIGRVNAKQMIFENVYRNEMVLVDLLDEKLNIGKDRKGAHD